VINPFEQNGLVAGRKKQREKQRKRRGERTGKNAERK
jgi:hypothetical protein